MQSTDSLEKSLMLGKITVRRRRNDRGWDDWMASLTRWTWIWASSTSWWWTGKLVCCSPGDAKSLTWLSNWTELIQVYIFSIILKMFSHHDCFFFFPFFSYLFSLPKIPIIHTLNGIRYPISDWGSVILPSYFMFYYLTWIVTIAVFQLTELKSWIPYCQVQT